MTDAPHTVMASSTPYVWSLILSFGTLLISIILIYIARFQAKLEIKDLAALRTMFDRYPAWGKRATRQISGLDVRPALQWNSLLHRIKCADVMLSGKPGHV